MTMTRIEYLTQLLAKTQAELCEIEASSHPFRAAFIKGWQERVRAVRANLSDAEYKLAKRERGFRGAYAD